MSSYKLLSHPDKKLIEHLKDVLEKGIKIYEENGLFSDDRPFMKAILIGHDLGKATNYFQDYITRRQSHGFIKNHGFLSAIMTFSIIKKILNLEYAIKGFIIVKRHHGNLHNIEDEIYLSEFESEKVLEILVKQLDSIDFEELNQILCYFKLPPIYKEEIIKDYEEFIIEQNGIDYFEDEFEKNIIKYYKIKYFYSILIYSDKHSIIIKSSDKKRKDVEYEDVQKYIQKLVKGQDKINYYREKARNEVISNLNNIKDRIMTLTLPTGLGKTLTSLNFALRLKEKLENEENRKYKIIYSFPFTSIIDQAYEIFVEIFGDDTSKLLKHHYLSKIEYKSNEEYSEIEEAKFLIETWDSSIIVTTFLKLLQGIFTNKNDELMKFANLANSIIILDEVQNIPFKYWKLINNSLKVISELFNVYIILMSATQPIIFEDGYEIVKDTKEYFNIFNRTRLEIDFMEKNIEEFVTSIIGIVNEHKRVMIVLNTVKSAQEVYNSLKGRVNKEILFLSASVIPRDRQERIKKIKELNEYVLVSTQVVEAGVDIDNDIVIRDIGPWDSIVQCAGRCNRNNRSEMGKVYIYNLKDKGKSYGSIIYGNFLINKTLKILEGKTQINERQFLKCSLEYFHILDRDKSDDYSTEILEDISNLKYMDVDEKFTLIENRDIYSIPVFIEKDNHAKKIWDKYEKIYDIKDIFKRKMEFLKIKDKFFSYVININIKKYPFHLERFFGRIPFENIEDYYSEEFGFYIDDNKAMFF